MAPRFQDPRAALSSGGSEARESHLTQAKSQKTSPPRSCASTTTGMSRRSCRRSVHRAVSGRGDRAAELIPSSRSAIGADLRSGLIDLADEVWVLGRLSIEQRACGVKHLEGAGLQRLGEVLAGCGGPVPSVHARHLTPEHDKDDPNL